MEVEELEEAKEQESREAASVVRAEVIVEDAAEMVVDKAVVAGAGSVVQEPTAKLAQGSGLSGSLMRAPLKVRYISRFSIIFILMM